MLDRVYTAECELCRTKFETDPGECPVCGGTSIRAIHEEVATAEAIPVPTGRTKPPAALRRGAAATRRAFEGSKVRKFEGSVSSTGEITGIRFTGVGSGAKAGAAPRGPDGRFLPRRKAAGGVAAARSRAASPARAPSTVRIDASDAAKRLEAAMAELKEARRASFAALRRKVLAESAVRRIRNEIRRAETAARAAFRGKGGLHSVLKTLGGIFSTLAAAALWKDFSLHG